MNSDKLGVALILVLLIVIFCLDFLPEKVNIWGDTFSEKKQVEKLKG
jgi:hypothetical protein